MHHATTPAPRAAQPPSALLIALTGAVALATAMGLGRFAFTPLLPLMVADGLVDLRQGSWLATLNYVGYLLGAIACMALPLLLRRRPGIDLRNWSAPLFLAGLGATAALLLAMALPQPTAWQWARFLAGAASAVAFVHVSGWCLEQLARRNANALSGLIYTGPGLGIVLSGMVASKMALWHASARQTWMAMGLLALLMLAWAASVVWRTRRSERQATSTAQTARVASHTPPSEGWTLEQLLLMVAYGLSGFGYIITATYLPVIAQTTIPGSPWIPLFWPVFGISVAIGAAAAGWAPAQMDRRWLLVICYLAQAVGVLLPLWLPTSAGFVLGSMLLGIPFTAITLFGMQEARRLRPLQATAFMGGLTTLYGVGQIAGPPLVVALLARSSDAHAGFALALWIAAASLVLGTAMLVAMVLRYRLVRGT